MFAKPCFKALAASVTRIRWSAGSPMRFNNHSILSGALATNPTAISEVNSNIVGSSNSAIETSGASPARVFQV